MSYSALVTELKAIKGIKFAEYEWETRPAGNFGTVQLDFEVDPDTGDDHKQNRGWQGSVDVYTHGKEMLILAAVESALESVCGSCWELNSDVHEHETGLIHREFVFEVDER